MRKAKSYLAMCRLDEALERIARAMADLPPAGEEELPTARALGRITARPVMAARSNPAFRVAAMDGYAVRSDAVAGASEVRPVDQELGRQAFPVDTGDPLPEGCDAVVMVEDVWPAEREGWIRIPVPVARWQHVRQVGEDVVEGEMVLPSGVVLEPRHLAAALAAGCGRVWVRRRPRVAILPTGDELVDPVGPIEPGQVPEFNSVLVGGLVESWGGEALVLPAVPDDETALRDALQEALGAADLVVVLAGSSAGRGDLTVGVLDAMGTLLFHGVNMMPGKPTCAAVVGRRLVLGLPGYPVSAAVAAEAFLKEALRWLLRRPAATRRTAPAVLARKTSSKAGHREIVRVRAAKVGDRVVAVPLSRGAGVIASLASCDGLVVFGEWEEGAEAGSRVQVELLGDPWELEHRLLHVGSHDPSLDHLAELARRQWPGWDLASVSVGSTAGLVALSRSFCHAAGVHLLDPESGRYNETAVRRFLPGRRVALVRLGVREQGLYVAPGNPKGIQGIGELARGDIQFVNRQPGSGTRILLDVLLAREGVTPDSVPGYETAETTHTAVAEAVRSGRADAGLGVRLPAKALGLDFVPLAEEPYELALLAETLECEVVARFLEVLRSDEARSVLESLPGYRPEGMGQVRVLDPEARP